MFKSPAGSGPVAAGESCLAGQSQSSVGWLSPSCAHLLPPVVAASWKWLDFSSQWRPRQPRAQQRWHTLGFLEAAYGDCSGTLPTTTCNLCMYSAATSHHPTTFYSVFRHRIGIQSTDLQIFRYSFYTSLQSKSTSVPP